MNDNFKDLSGGAEVVKHFRTLSVEFQGYLLTKLAEEHANAKKDPFIDVRNLYLQHRNKIDAIKQVRAVAQTTGRMEYYHLKDAKDLVESWLSF